MIFFHELLYMSSRFGLYQNSMKKFITSQSIISKYNNKQFIFKLSENSELGLRPQINKVINPILYEKISIIISNTSFTCKLW